METKDIQVLDSISHIQLRPAMYIGDLDDRGVYHLVKEILDNALDELLAKHANVISIILDDDLKGISIYDNGRGIPFEEKVEKTGKTALVTVFQSNNSGAKFKEGAYSTSAGLHGVGATATNALSSVFIATSYRNGKQAVAEFHDGILQTDDAVISNCDKTKKGTLVYFKPNWSRFFVDSFDLEKIQKRISEVVCLVNDLKITFTHKGETKEYHARHGLSTYIKDIYKTNMYGLPDFYYRLLLPNEGKKCELEYAFIWDPNAEDVKLSSYVNLTPTPSHGTHMAGFEKALFDFLLEKAKNKCEKEDLQKGFRCVVSLKHHHPEFFGNTKDRLINKSLPASIAEAFAKNLEFYYKKNKDYFNNIIERSVANFKDREEAKKLKKAKSALKSTSKRSRNILPSKLCVANCKPADRELFICEGDSAFGTIVKARDSKKHEILPIRGKIINPFKKSLADCLKNEEIASILQAIGADIGEPFDLSRCRVGKVILLSDADSDGKHINTLLLSVLAKFARPLLDAGMVYVVDAPLFVGSLPNSKDRYFGHTDEEVKKKAGAKATKLSITRLKGHGEADKDELFEYAIDPATRRLFQIEFSDDDYKQLSSLMADDGEVRKDLLGVKQ